MKSLFSLQNKRVNPFFRFSLAAGLFSAGVNFGGAVVVNPGFEDFVEQDPLDIPDWQSTGFAGSSDSDGIFIIPTEGVRAAGLGVGVIGFSPTLPEALAAFFDTSVADIQALQPNASLGDGSGIGQTVTFPSAGTLSFDWNFYPFLAIQLIDNGDFGSVQNWYETALDTAFFSLNGGLTKIADLQDFRDLNPDLQAIDPDIPWQTSFITIEEPGEYEIGVGFVEAFIVTDELGGGVGFGNMFLVDNFQFTPIPEPGTVAAGALFLGLIAFAAWRRRRAAARTND